MPVSFHIGHHYFFSGVVQTAIHLVYLPSPYWTTKMLWMSLQRTLAKFSICCSYHFGHTANSLVTEGNCFGGTVLVFLNSLVLCHPRNGFQKHVVHDLWERYLVRMTAPLLPAPCFDEGYDICFFPVTGNPIWLPQPLEVIGSSTMKLLTFLSTFTSSSSSALRTCKHVIC